MLKPSSYTLHPDESYYDPTIDLPLEWSTLRIDGMCEEDFWHLITVDDTSGNCHRMKASLVADFHFIDKASSPAGAHTLVLIEITSATKTEAL